MDRIEPMEPSVHGEWIEPLMDWYRQNARDLPWRRTRSAYAVYISEVMLQQTRAAAVIPYYERFLAALPNVAALAAVDDDRLHKLWEGLGYYSRADNLKRAAQEVCMRFGGVLPVTYEELLTLPGVGEYTAGAIASIAFGARVPAVDGNVLRVWARLMANESDMRAPISKKRVRDALLPLVPTDAGTFNAALMELGACVCLPNGMPRCESCPIGRFCRARACGKETILPVLGAKKARRVEGKTVFALAKNGVPYVLRRPKNGLLAGLWQLPETTRALSEQEAAAWIGENGLLPAGELRFYDRKHIFTHVEWHMRVCAAEVTGEPPAGWLPLDESRALPSAYRICLEEGR